MVAATPNMTAFEQRGWVALARRRELRRFLVEPHTQQEYELALNDAAVTAHRRRALFEL